MGNRSWRAWSLPQVPQGVRKVGDRARRVLHAGCLGQQDWGSTNPASHPKQGVGDGLRCSPSGRQRGEGQSQGFPFGLQGSEWESLASPMCPWGGGGRRGGPGPPAPGTWATRARPRPGSRSPARPAAASMCCSSPTTPSRCCLSAAWGKGAMEEEG